MIKFTEDPAECTIIEKIAHRAAGYISRYEYMLYMDISACHMTTPLQLQELLDAGVVDFVHDVAGIVKHLDRNTGELGDCFVPRFARRQS